MAYLAIWFNVTINLNAEWMNKQIHIYEGRGDPPLHYAARGDPSVIPKTRDDPRKKGNNLFEDGLFYGLGCWKFGRHERGLPNFAKFALLTKSTGT